MRNPRNLTIIAIAVVFAVVLAACGSDHNDQAATSDDPAHSQSSGSHDEPDDPHSDQAADDGHAAESQDPHGAVDIGEVAEGEFPIVGFEVQAQTMVPFPPSEVCPLFEPSGRFLLYEDWNESILREPQGDTLVGLVTSSTAFGLDVIVSVTEHRREEGWLEYVALWDDFELQVIGITCVEGDSADSTSVTWDERNAGLHEIGVSAVTQFIQAGAPDMLLQRYGQNVAAYLAAQ